MYFLCCSLVLLFVVEISQFVFVCGFLTKMSACEVQARSENKSEPNMYNFLRYSVKTNNVLEADSVSHPCIIRVVFIHL